MSGPRRSRDPRKSEELSSPSAIDARRLRALAEPLDVRLRSREPYPRFEVRNPVHRTRYLVLLPASPERAPALCTCTDFARRGLGDCKHIEAVWRWLATHPPAEELPNPPGEEPTPSEVWEEVDRRTEAAPPLAERDIRALGRPGRVLFERSRAG